jgi:quinol monooxygenase YgiN
MDGPIVYVDRSRIHDGSLEDLQRGMCELVAFVRENEPQIVAYSVYIDEAGGEMSVVHVHRDEASLEVHMKVAGPEFPKVAPFITLESIDVYGMVGDDLVGRLRQKAELLGSGVVRVHGAHGGFIRPAP